MTYQKERARHEQMSCFFFIRSGEYGPQSIFLECLQKKVTIIYRRNKNEKKQKMCATIENTWFWIVREKIQKNKKKTCIIAADWIY